jgi:hypothetical protein
MLELRPTCEHCNKPLIIHHMSPAAEPRRPTRPEKQLALGLAEFPWVQVSFADRDLFFRD